MSQGRSIFEKWTAAEFDAARKKKLQSVSRQQTITMPDGRKYRVKMLCYGWAINRTHFYVQTADDRWHRYTTKQMLGERSLYEGFQNLLQ